MVLDSLQNWVQGTPPINLKNDICFQAFTGDLQWPPERGQAFQEKQVTSPFQGPQNPKRLDPES